MRAAFLIISTLLIAYVVSLAIVVPFSIDETWTWEEFVKGEFWNVVTYAHPVPNNHILNSLLVKPFAAVSNSELSLRLPNVLAFLLYLYAAYSISTQLFTDKWLRVCLFTALMLNTTLIHFFALCRGYGISIGLLLFSISRLLLFTRPFKARQLHTCLITGILAVYASFTVLPAYLAIAAAAFYIDYRKEKNLWTAIKSPLCYTLLIIALIAYPIRQAMRWDSFDYGGTSNFFEDTLFTFLKDLLGDTAHLHKQVVLALVSLVFLLAGIAILYRVIKKQQPASYFIAPFILLVCVVCINLEFYLLGVRFIIYRTTLYLYPLGILSLFSCAAIYAGSYQRTVRSLTVISTGILLYFFCTQIYFTEIPEWRFDAPNKKVFSFIEKNSPPGKKLQLFVYHLSVNSFNYYISTRYKDRIEPVSVIRDIKTVNLNNYDYIYLNREEDISAYTNFKVVQAYNDSSFLLYRKLP